MAWLKKNWFNAALVSLFALALAAPGLGAEDGPLYPAVLRTAGVVVIFFLTGLTLRLDEFKRGVANPRLHLFTQSFSFVFVPAVAVALRAGLAGLVPAEILQGIVALAILPTTITSCVIFTGLARGNVAGAVFGSIAGNMGGVVASPLLFTLLIAPAAGVQVDWSQLWTIVEIIVVPLAAGLALRPRVQGPLARVKGVLPYVSGSALLMIVFFAFASAFAPASPLWRWSPAELAAPLAVIALLHAFLLAAAWWLSAAVGLAEADRRAALFVAPQKTVALGLPLLHVFFAAQPALAGLMAIPLIFYHPLQLLVAGALASRLASRAGGLPQ